METDNTQTQQDVDLERVQGFIRAQVESSFKEMLEQYNNNNQQQTQQPAQTQEEQARSQIRNIIDPLYRPEIDATKLVAADTRDYVDFYGDASLKIDSEDKEAVEKMFNELKASGRPLPRRDIYDYLQGKLSREKPEEFSKKTTERQRRQLETANGAGDMGIGALERAKGDPQYDPRRMTLSDLESALDGVAF